MAVEPGLVNETRLRALLAEEHESDAVEFKDVWDLEDRKHIVELALAVGAMQSCGGYVVVGVDGRGEPTGNLTDRHVELLDPATVDDKIGRYLPPPINIRVGRHRLGANVVLIYVERRAEGLTAFLRDGSYSDETGRQVVVFRQGDVYTRRGTKTVRVSQEDIARAFAGTTAPGSTELGWELAPAEFERAFARALHEYDGREARTLIRRALAVAKESLANGDSLLVPLLDRLTLAGLVLIDEEQTLGNLARLRDIVEAFAGIYELALDAADRVRAIGEVARHELWTEVVVRFYAIGAYAVRAEAWEAVPVLVARDTRAQRVDDGDLLGHWRQQATDRGLLIDRGIPVQEAAAELVGASDWARPDGVEAEAVLDSVCAFDQLASLVYAAAAVSAGVDLELASLYGNSGLVGVERGDPILARLLDDEHLRNAVFPHRDLALRRALQILLGYARQEAHAAGRDRFQSHTWGEVDRFIRGEEGSRSAPRLAAPDIVLGHPSHQPVFAIGADDKRYVETLKPRYLIENKTADVTARDITTGIRTRDGRELAFDAFRAPALLPGETAPVEGLEVPYEYLAGIHESAVGTVLLYWARFTDPDGVRWCVTYDPQTRSHEYTDE